MKKILSFVVCLALLISIVPVSVFAESETDLEAFLYDAVMDCQTQIDISSYKIACSDANKAELDSIMREIRKKTFHMNSRWQIYNDGAYYTRVNVNYDYTKAELAEVQAATNTILHGIVGNSTLTDVEKALLIHDRLIVWCEYDEQNYRDNTVPRDSYSAYGALAKGVAVCEGYAEAYTYLLAQVGIDSYVTTSATLNHAWNIVTINGKKYHVDTTWDDADVSGCVSHSDFLLSSNALYERHRANDYDMSPDDTTYDTYDWQNSLSEFCLVGNEIYYIDNAKIKKASDHTEVFSTGGFNSRLATDGETLFYSTSDAIYKLDLAANTSSLVFQPDSCMEGDRIDGFIYRDGYLICDLSSQRRVKHLYDTKPPAASITSTNDVSPSQTVTINMWDNAGIAGYYWGTSSTYQDNPYTPTNSGSATVQVSDSGTYYLTVKDIGNHISETKSITFYKTTLNGNGATVTPSYIITASGNSFPFPAVSKSGWKYKGWATSVSGATAITSLTPTADSTYYAVFEKFPFPVTNVEIVSEPTKTEYYLGDEFNTAGLELKITYSDGSTQNVTSGFTTGGFSSASAGVKPVTVSYEGFTNTFHVTVLTPSMILPSGGISIPAGQSSDISAVTIPGGQAVAWTSSNPSVASVRNGRVTANSAGEAEITASFTYNGKKYSSQYKITVNPESYSGTCGKNGDNLTWSLDADTGVLTITGSGAMANYWYGGSPWYKYCNNIKSVEIDDGVTNIGDYAFLDCGSVTSITIPASVTNIGNNAFLNCSGLESIAVDEKNSCFTCINGILYDNPVTKMIAVSRKISGAVSIPNGVTSIDAQTFYNCSNLTSVTIPDSVTSIGDSAFSGCTGLMSVTIPASVTSMGDHVFYYCSSLTSINIPDGVTSIGWNAFLGCSSLTSITIPASVTSIVDSAFAGCSSLTSITIPASVTSIGNSAFAGCSSLTSITIPASVTSMGASAFFNCNSLTSITIPVSVTSIGNNAFYKCSSLCTIYNFSDLNITLGSTNHGYIAYYAKIIVDKNGNKTYINDGKEYIDTEDGFLFEKSDGAYKLIAYFGKEETVTLPSDIDGNAYEIYRMRGVRDVIIPEGVTSIGDSAFSDCGSLVSITIPDSVTSIGAQAFYNCSSLTSITIPDGVTSIGWQVFSGCSSLVSINMPDSVTSIADYAFGDCSSLTRITIPAGVTSIGDSAFSGCSSLESIEADEKNNCFTSADGILYDKAVTEIVVVPHNISGAVSIPNGVTSIGDNAFYECSSLMSITIPDSVTSIEYAAFFACRSLTSITIPDSVASIGRYAFQYCNSLTSVTIPDSVTSIGDGVFYGCSSLTSINIPAGVTWVGDWAFYGCSSLTSINIPDTVTYLGFRAFSGCKITDFIISPGNTFFACVDGVVYNKELTAICFVLESAETVIIPSTVKHIGLTFRDNKTIKKVSFADGSQLTSIGNCAFSGCGSLTSITIPDSVTRIGDSAFQDCSSLTIVMFGENSRLTSIDSYAFSGCSSLASMSIPASVTSIGRRVFSGCSSLTSIVVAERNNCYTSVDGILYDKPVTRIIAVPQNISGVVSIPNGVTGIDVGEFSDCSSLTGVTIPDGVTRIGDAAFSRCSSLISLTIPDSVRSIGYNAFSECNSLTSVMIPDGVTRIGDHTFFNCSSLTSINIPDSVTHIGDYAFHNCSSFTNINIPDGMTRIGNHAFSGCSSLTSINIPNSLTSIGNNAFRYCSSLYVIYNNSDLNITLGSTDYGRITDYAKIIVDKNGNKTYVNDGKEYIDTDDGFLFEKSNGANKLIAYFGKEETVTLPNDIDGNPYEIYRMRGVRNVIVPDGVTRIGYYAFDGCHNAAIYGNIGSYAQTYANERHIPFHGHTWDDGRVTTEPAAGVQGVETHTCMVCGLTGTETIPALPINITVHEDNVGGANITSTEEELKNAVLSGEDLALMENGTPVKVFIQVKDAQDTVSDADVQLIEAALNGHKVGLYLDISLYKQVGDGAAAKVEETSGKIKIAIKIPAELTAEGRTYKIIRVHDGAAQVIDGEFDSETNVFTFETDRFSTYAIVYPDGVTVSGRVVSYGDEAEAVTIELWQEGQGEASYVTTVSGNNAAYSIEAVAAGTYTLKVMKKNHVTREYTITVGDNAVTQDVKIHLLGDINGDGTVNNKDVTRLFQYLSDWDVNVNEAALDVNGDGTVNNKDLTRLFQYLSDWDVEIY